MSSSASSLSPTGEYAQVRVRTAQRFAALLAALTLWRVWFVHRMPLSGDEAYHWEWSRHLALGYYDHPGLLAYSIALAAKLLGTNSVLAVRLPAVLAGTATAWALFCLTRRMATDTGMSEERSARAGLWAGLLFIVVPVFAVFAQYMTGDPLLFLAWTLCLHALWCALQSGRLTTWLLAGLLLGVGLQAKLLMLAMVPSLGLFLLWSRTDRRWLWSPRPILALLVAGVLFAPFLYWNATHHWDTFRFNVERQSHRFSLLTSLELAASQAVAFSPVAFLAMILAASGVVRRGLTNQTRPLCLLTCAFAFPLLAFAASSVTQRIGLHWPAMSGLAGIALCGIAWESARGSTREAGAVRLRRWSLGVATALIALAHIAVVVPPEWIRWLSVSYAGRPDMISSDKHRELYGWEEFGQELGTKRAEMLAATGPGGPGVFLMGPQYGVVALAAFYTPGQPATHVWGAPIVHGQNYKYWDDYPALAGQDAVFFTKKERLVWEHLWRLRSHFREVGNPEELLIKRDGVELRAFYFVRCRGFNGVAPTFE